MVGFGRIAVLAAVVMALGAGYCAASDGYGMGVEAFSSDKSSALHNEAFTVLAQVKNISADKFPGGPVGAALVDNNGGVAAVVGIFNSFKPLNPGESLSAKINCAAPNDVTPGQYKLMIVIRPKGKDWKTVETSASGGVPTAVAFTLNSKDESRKLPDEKPPVAAVANNAHKDDASVTPSVPSAPSKEPKPEQIAEINAKPNDSSLKPGPRQIDDIKAKWQQYKPKAVTTVFAETPVVTKPYSPGALTPEFLANGLNTFKFVRYLADLSENIVYTDELNDLGQHGAVILAAIGQLTHTPSRPSDMPEAFYKRARNSTETANIHMNTAKTASLQDAVRGFCDDSDEGNIDRLGHRRWMLNPKLGKVGFGYAASAAGNFIPIQVFDKSNTEKIDVDYVLWPNKGYFPSGFFAPAQAWSVSLNPASYDLNKCKPTVKLTSISSGKEWKFSASDNNKSGKYFNIEKKGFGMPYCIIFRPDGVSPLDVDKRFKVEIGGLVDKSDKPRKIEYEVEFFTLAEK